MIKRRKASTKFDESSKRLPVLSRCRVQLFAIPWTSTPGSSVHGDSPESWKKMEGVAMPSSRGSSQPRDQTQSPTLQADSLPPEPPGKPRNTGVSRCLQFQDQFHGVGFPAPQAVNSVLTLWTLGQHQIHKLSVQSYMNIPPFPNFNHQLQVQVVTWGSEL